MNIIHVVETLPRLVDSALTSRLRVMPAVVLAGARQTGKSTLVETMIPGRRLYRSLDDFDARDAARRDPEALRGGFPTPALQLTTPSDRAIWFDGHVRTYLARDLQDLAACRKPRTS